MHAMIACESEMDIWTGSFSTTTLDVDVVLLVFLCTFAFIHLLLLLLYIYVCVCVCWCCGWILQGLFDGYRIEKIEMLSGGAVVGRGEVRIKNQQKPGDTETGLEHKESLKSQTFRASGVSFFPHKPMDAGGGYPHSRKWAGSKPPFCLFLLFQLLVLGGVGALVVHSLIVSPVALIASPTSSYWPLSTMPAFCWTETGRGITSREMEVSAVATAGGRSDDGVLLGGSSLPGVTADHHDRRCHTHPKKRGGDGRSFPM